MADKSKNLADVLFPKMKDFDEDLVLNVPLEQRQLHTEAYDFSVSTIYQYIQRGQMNIPLFQRGYVWTRTQASRLIESLIIQCPIPVIFLNQEADETYSVIDGNQRIKSIEYFLEDQFPLSGLTAYPDLEGYTFSSLDVRIQRHIQNRIIRCIVILKTTHPQIKFDVFSRINTGAVQLNPQELRHGIYFGSFAKLIDRLCEYEKWKKMIGVGMSKRMKDAELIVRFFSLYYAINNYTKPLNNFLNEFNRLNRQIDDRKEEEYKKLFFFMVDDLYEVFGANAFRTYDEHGALKSSQLNAALFDAVSVGYAKNRPQLMKIVNNKRQFEEKYFQKINEIKFLEYITAGTSTKAAVTGRLAEMERFFAQFK